MMFESVFIEEQVRDHPKTRQIMAALRPSTVTYIRKVEDVFGRVRKPYLQKRQNLNLFIGRKEGQLVKPAPDAYGFSKAPHYYFIHQYNCLYECTYCYLQGYFDSPDIVFFVNHDDICAEIERLCRDEHQSDKMVWFHAGEFSDSLALTGVTREWDQYWDTFARLPAARLELRTKSNNVRWLTELPPMPNIVITFSVSPQAQIERYDRGTPPLLARLKAARRLAAHGYQLGFHFDPIIDYPGLMADYQELAEQIVDYVPESAILYVSLGVVRFTKDVYADVQRHYPDSPLHGAEFVKSFDGKVRYSRPHRLWLLKQVKDKCIRAGIDAGKVYLCMEE